MTDYIKRDDILDRTVKRNSIWNGITNACGQGLEEIVNNIPPSDVIPVRHGFWKQISPAKVYECSKCGQNVMTYDIDVYEWCHGCGAKMDEK